MPIYEFKHPVTKEIFEEFRLMKDSDLPYIAKDGVVCERIFSSFTGINGSAEVWEKCPDEVKSYCPKYVRHRSGYKERYNPHKHC